MRCGPTAIRCSCDSPTTTIWTTCGVLPAAPATRAALLARKAKLEQLKAEHGVVDAEPAKKKPSKPQNAGFTMPDKTGDQPASDQQPAAQPQS